MIGGQSGMVIAFFIALAMNFFSYWYSDKIVLTMYRAKEVSKQEAPELHRIVENLSYKAGIPKPKVYIMNNSSANAFATGRDPNHSAVAVTTGILQILDYSELEGVLGHELAHIKNKDILIGTIAATIAAAIMVLASFARFAAYFGGFSRDRDEDGGGIFALLAIAILAPIAALLIQMAISRSREYLADGSGAKISGNPLKLSNALKKLEAQARAIPLNANPSTAHMFIVNPLKGQFIASLFSTHPPIEKRVEKLESMAYGIKQ
jgi:heat shock protein HtpX